MEGFMLGLGTCSPVSLAVVERMFYCYDAMKKYGDAKDMAEWLRRHDRTRQLKSLTGYDYSKRDDSMPDVAVKSFNLFDLFKQGKKRGIEDVAIEDDERAFKRPRS
ncbi:hypothetical protein K470DRAFT_258433 [Piedraia hortae CBS 480.64]|uniref:Uncharacterized protein n=1 Tax=Piedraia hortae CBS 480.64 TaxID=1314780 RepID=A0A6A7BXF0_9PEZI|nr:hypothetical protein K470DRAFT_258433 [Piedraia hortae CBS 480.64]